MKQDQYFVDIEQLSTESEMVCLPFWCTIEEKHKSNYKVSTRAIEAISKCKEYNDLYQTIYFQKHYHRSYRTLPRFTNSFV